MIDINKKGLLYVSKAIIPQMIEKIGHIINRLHCSKKCIQMETSIVPQNMPDALNQGMRMIDLNPFGIRVGAIHPGMVPNSVRCVSKEIRQGIKCV
jgi:NADP-dependent 3-hydroxy acid dehydrogenase YdfG